MMAAGFSLEDSTVAILGLGLMGGSLAMALRGKCRSLAGFDADASTAETAAQRRIVERLGSDAASTVRHADLVILATPVPAILDALAALPAWTPDSCVVMDLGSSKGRVVDAMALLPDRFDPIGGHPLCGKEKLSLDNADGGLYRGAAFLLTPLERTTARALSAAQQIIDAIGASPVFIQAADHDRLLALTSHMPFLLSSALAMAVPAECSALVGPGFRSTARLAGTPASMMLGTLGSNRENVLSALHALQRSLADIESALSFDDLPRLEALLNHAQSKYRGLVE